MSHRSELIDELRLIRELLSEVKKSNVFDVTGVPASDPDAVERAWDLFYKMETRRAAIVRELFGSIVIREER